MRAGRAGRDWAANGWRIDVRAIASAGALGLVVALMSAGASSMSADARRSGLADLQPATRAMQLDDAQNPAMLWLVEGESAWARRPGARTSSCADCHGDATRSMRGVAARYPAFDAALGTPVDLGQRIDVCRQRHQAMAPFGPESPHRLQLETFVAHQSRGLPIAPPDDPRLAGHRARGARLYGTRLGQLDLSCADCHDRNAGRRLGGSVIPQAHPTGYPIYRLEWQAVGSLQRRLRGCLTGVRAQAYPYDAIELIELQLHLMHRASGMSIETPAVRP
jgi:sulfur-oxidizing protein SoxA